GRAEGGGADTSISAHSHVDGPSWSDRPMISPHGLSAVAPPPDRSGTNFRPERQTTGSVTGSITGSADRPTTGPTAADRIGSSVIRDLLALTERPGVISLAGGLPDLDLLDPERIRAAADH